jgi:isopentenyldiphosphate isomerase
MNLIIILLGKYNEDPLPDPAEVAEWKWLNFDKVSNDLEKNRQKYTYWFPLIQTSVCMDCIISVDKRYIIT